MGNRGLAHIEYACHSRLDRHRSRFPGCFRNRLVGHPAETELHRRLLLSRQERRLVCGRRVFVRVKHRVGASRRAGWHRGGKRRRFRAPRISSLAGPAALGMALRPLLHPKSCLYHARVLGKAVLPRGAMVPIRHLRRRLRLDQDQRHDLCGWRGLRNTDGNRFLD